MQETEEQAAGLKKFSLISPVLNGQEPNVSEYFRRLSAMPVKMPGVGERRYSAKTYAKWLYDYRRYGFSSLVKNHRNDRGVRRKITSELGEMIAKARIDNPKMPVTVLYEKLIGDGVIDPSAVSRPTLYRFIEDLTLSGELVKSSEEVEVRRFCHERVNEMWQADLLYGPEIKIKGKKAPTYLHAIIDDCSRYPMWSQFYLDQNFETFRHCFKEAALRRGMPRLAYTDNGRIYRSQQLEYICASLGCTMIHSQPYVPKGRGKVERYFRTVRMRFLSTIDATGITSLDELNMLYFKWMEEDYKRKAHSELNGLSPHDVLMSQVENMKIGVDTRVLDEAFLYRASRKVQHDATIQLNNVLYETEPCFAGKRLELRYDIDWVGDVNKKLPLFFDGKKVGDAWMVRFHDNAHAKRRFTGNRKIVTPLPDRGETAILYSEMKGGDVNV